jgi:uncharacterized protein (TIGR03084 family)
MPNLARLCSDLEAEHRSLDEIVRTLDEGDWDRPSAAEGWSVRDQISHLAFFDEAGTQAVTDPTAFTAGLDAITRDPVSFMEDPLIKGRAMPTGEVLDWWRQARSGMLAAFADVDPDVRIPWYGPPMKPASFISARLMETWAHGQDIVDALGIGRAPTDRLKHIVHLGFRARPNSYAARGLPLPDEPVRLEVRGPDGDLWTYGEGDDVVRADALDFCLVVTQRRHLDDTNVETVGDLAAEWMSIAQAFAGPPGSGREPGQFPRDSVTS